jgi:hypothetical protein
VPTTEESVQAPRVTELEVLTGIALEREPLAQTRTGGYRVALE